MIRYIQFRGDVAVTVGGKFTAINAWDHSKHGEAGIRAEVKDGFVFLYPPPPNKDALPRRKRIPMTSVAYIDEDADAAPKAKA